MTRSYSYRLILKRITAFVLAAVCLITAVSCTVRVKEHSHTLTVTDDLGRQVTVPAGGGRVAALSGSYADMWLLAGGSLAAVTDDAFELGLSLPTDILEVGTTHAPSLEAILAARPDTVIASAKLSRHLELESSLTGAGICVIYLEVEDFETYLDSLRLLTDITGNSDRYRLYGEAQRERIDAVISRCEGKTPPRVLTLRASAASMRVKDSDGTMLGGMLYDMGAVNIADGDSSLTENLSIEKIALSDVDMIFIVQAGDSISDIRDAVEEMFSQNPLWSSLTATEAGRVFYMEKELYNMKPNAKFAEAYEKLEEILYEE